MEFKSSKQAQVSQIIDRLNYAQNRINVLKGILPCYDEEKLKLDDLYIDVSKLEQECWKIETDLANKVYNIKEGN